MTPTSVADTDGSGVRQWRGVSARQRLLQAALVQFAIDGTVGATLEDIRGRAGVSVGALYHHFSDKRGLVAALYGELMEDFQQGFVAELHSHSSADDGVKSGVRFYLRWVSANRDAAAFLLWERPAEADELRGQNRRFFVEVMTWWDTHVHYGALRELPFDVVNSLWLGPAHEYTRHWVAGR